VARRKFQWQIQTVKVIRWMQRSTMEARH